MREPLAPWRCVPRNRDRAARACAGTALGGALVSLIPFLAATQPLGRASSLGLLCALMLVLGLALCGLLALWIPHRLPAGFLHLVPLLAVLVAADLNLLTQGESAAGLLLFCPPVVYAAYALRPSAVAGVLAAVALGFWGVQMSTTSWAEALGNTAAAVAVATLWSAALLRTRQGEQGPDGPVAHGRLEALVADSSDVITLCEADGEVSYASPAATRILGRDPQDLRGRRLRDLAHPEDRPALDAALDAVGGRRHPDRPETVVWRLGQAEGPWRHLETLVTREPRDDGLGAVLLHTRDVTEQVALRYQLQYQATHDEMTGLPNREFLWRRLHEILSVRGAGQSEYVGLMMIDLHGFSGINDMLGNDSGDTVLRTVATRLAELNGPHCLVARLGGDEFVVLLHGFQDPSHCTTVAERALCTIEEPVMVGERSVSVTARVGVAVARTDSTEPHVIRDADLALRAAKKRNERIVVFTPVLCETAVVRFDLHNELCKALSSGELVLHYQPVVDLESGRPSSVEALVRWAHPTRGLLSPLLFIPIAEENGMVEELGRWVLDEAVRQIVEWERQGLRLDVAVNLSVRQLHRGLTSHVDQVLGAHGLAPERLVLEVTESMLVRDTSGLEELTCLREMGTRLAIDDFGTGYSSLSYLGRLPVDILKIDRSFTSGVGLSSEMTALADGIIALAQRFRLAVVAEGIETDLQLDHLRRMGCGRGQGYLFARPTDPDQLLQHMRNPHPDGLRCVPTG